MKILIIALLAALTLFASTSDQKRENSYDLLQAITDNDTQKALSLIKKGIDFKSRYPQFDYRTPMRRAVEFGNTKVVQALFDAGYTFPKGTNRPTPIVEAVWNKDYPMAELLMQHGADPLEIFYNDQSAVTIAVRDNMYTFIYMFVNYMSDAQKMELAKYALKTNNRRIYTFLVDNVPLTINFTNSNKPPIKYIPDFDVNYQDENGRTVIMYAIEAENIDFSQMAYQKGAKLTLKDKNGVSALDLINETSNRTLYDLFSNAAHKPDDLKLINAVLNGDERQVKQLLKQHVNLETVDVHGSTALIHASAKNYANIVTLLLDAGAVCNVKTSYGFTPLMIAANNGSKESAKILFDHKCYINPQGKAEFKKHNAWARGQYPEFFHWYDAYKQAHGF